jgi:hypothetical protein
VLFVPAFSFVAYLVLAARMQRTQAQDCKLKQQMFSYDFSFWVL